MKTRNKRRSKARTARAARKGGPSRQGRRFAIGDVVRIVNIANALKDPNYDLKTAEGVEMRTAELFRFCTGRQFEVKGFQKDWVELEVSDDPSVRRKFGKWQTIWIEPEFLEHMGEGTRPRKRKTN